MTRMERITEDILKDFEPFATSTGVMIDGEIQIEPSVLYDEKTVNAIIKAAFRSALWKTWMSLDDPEVKPKLYIEGGEVHEVPGE